MAALTAGLLLRALFLVHYSRVAGDSLVYGDIAKNLLEHHVYGFSESVKGVTAAPRPTLIRLPGYPLFLALCFRMFGMEHYTAVLEVQVGLDLWTCLLLGGVAARIFGRRAGLAAVWLGVLCPFTANYTAAPLTETLTLFCMAAALYGLLRWGGEMDRWVFLLGFALAYAVFLRPEQGILAAAVVPGMVWMTLRRVREGMSQGLKPGFAAEAERSKAEALSYLESEARVKPLRPVEANGHGGYLKALLPVIVAAVLTVLPLGPWAARNWRTFHVFQPLAPRYANDPGEANPEGFERWYRTWAVEFASTEDVYWNYNGSPIEIRDLPDRAFDSQAQLRATARLLEDYNKQTTSTPGLDERFDAIARERIGGKPLRYYVALPVGRVLNMMLRPRTEMLPVPLEWWKFQENVSACLFAAGYVGLNLAYFVLAGVVLARRPLWRGKGVLVGSMVATIVLRLMLLLTLDNSEPRYTLEFFPVLIVLVAGLWQSTALRR